MGSRPTFPQSHCTAIPYVIFYSELADRIEVLAIAHGAREPGYWLKRR